jgi:hypothetical protein
MKKIIALFVIVVLSSAANMQVFSQKIKTSKKLPDVTNELPIIKKNDAPTDVKIKRAEAYSDGGGVYIRWQTEYENKNLGFYIYRVNAKGSAVLVNQSFVAGGRSTSSEDVVYGGIYSYFDENGDASSSYYIESLQINGNRQVIGQVSTKSVNDLTPLAGSSSRELKKKNEDAAQSLEGEIEVNLPKELIEQYENNLEPPDIITQRWVAAQPGAKISVKQQGIYRVTRTALQNAGFDVNAPSANWQLYLDGKQQAINIGAGDAYVEFYGQGIDVPESDTKVYYLIAGAQPGLRMNSTVLRPLSGSIQGTSYYQSFVKRDKQIYLSPDILNGDADNFFSTSVIIGSNSTPTTATVNFTLTGVDFNQTSAYLELGVQGITGTPHQIVAKINGETLPQMSGNGYNLITGSFPIPTSFLREGANSLQLQEFSGAGSNNVVESIRVSYNRKYQALSNRLSTYTSNYRQTTISNFASANIRVFDLTYPDNPALLTGLTVTNNSGNFSVTLPSNRGRSVFATEDSAILSPVSVAANSPSTWSTAAHNGELVIVTWGGWLAEANTWANYRRAQGLTVEVVDIEDIYDEFGYGTLSSSSMTDFFKFAKDNWQTAPNYVLLLGDFSYDYRNYENRAFQNYIPSKRVDTLYEETGSDEALCDFNNDGLAEIAIGRIPARTAAQVTQAFNKMSTFESSLGTAFGRGALFVSDLNDTYDFEGLNSRVATQLPPSIPKTYLNRSTTTKPQMLGNLNLGYYVVNYSGHGAAGSWNGEWINLTDAAALTNAPNYTIFNMLTCMNGYFLRTDFDSLGEALLKAQNGGAVAVWASTGKTTPDVQEVLATRFYNQLNAGVMIRFGDLVKDAKQNVTGGRDVRLSWALLGDPTMKVRP